MLRRLFIVTLLLGAVWAAPAHASTWCGAETTADRTPELLGGPAVHVVYALPADGTDRLGTLGSAIETDVEHIDAWWRGQDPTRTPRFDQFPFPCGPQADIATVRLAAPAAQITSPAVVINGVEAAATEAGLLRSGVVVLAYYDGPATTANVCGIGGQTGPGAEGGVAVVLVGACPGTYSEWVAAHELGHALGAVPDGAPHLCADGGHTCDTSADLMYPYVYDGRPLSSAILDPGHDDYYAHSGSWLDVQDSSFLRHLDSQVTLSLAITGEGSVVSDPVGVTCSASCATDWDGGSTVSLSAGDPAAGMRFVRWSGACTGEDVCEVTLDAPRSVSAFFAPETFGLGVAVTGRGTVTSRPRGIACKPRCRSAFTSYEPVKLTAKPARGWRLKAWSGGCKGARALCTVPMSAAASARAVFVRKR